MASLTRMNDNLTLVYTLGSHLIPGVRCMLDRHGIGSMISPLENETSEIHVRPERELEVIQMINGYLESQAVFPEYTSH